MNDEELKAAAALRAEMAFLCENGARAAMLLDARSSPAAVLLGQSLLEDLAVLYRRGVGKELAEERRKFQLELSAASEKMNARAVEIMRVQGPKLWGEWHRRALRIHHQDTKAPSEEEEGVWLKGLVAQIPCSDCKTHFQGLLQEHPPVFGEGYFAYTVMMHNLVNERIGKAQVTEQQARGIWA